MSDVNAELNALKQELLLVMQQQQKQLLDQLKQFNHALEQLGAVDGLEYSNDVKDWVSKKKLMELKKNPRDGTN